MPGHGPTIYVAGLMGKEDAWKKALHAVWAHLLGAARLQLTMLGARDVGAQAQAARIAHGLLVVGFVVSAGLGDS